MLPRPASIAAAPSPKSQVCWSPAVPPPPVGGAAVGNGVGLAVAAGAGVGVVAGVGVPVAAGAGVALWVGDAVELAVSLGVAVAEALDEGDDEGSDAEGDDVQAEIAAEASMATMPQPTAVSLAPSAVRAAAMCIFMEPPHASCRRPRYPVSPLITVMGRGKAQPARSLPEPTEGGSPKAPRAINVKPIGGETCNGLFITGISGYASRSSWGREGPWGTWSGGV
jgi:hypothetical protein